MPQQPPPASNSAPSLPFSPDNITTKQIQKYLDENKNLILAILDNQNLGKIAECAQYQSILQRNLMYLAAIADTQPQPTTAPSQGTYVQQNQTTLQQQQGVPVPKLPFQLNALQPQDQQHELLHFQQQQQFESQIGTNNGMHQILQPGPFGSGNLM